MHGWSGVTVPLIRGTLGTSSEKHGRYGVGIGWSKRASRSILYDVDEGMANLGLSRSVSQMDSVPNEWEPTMDWTGHAVW